MSRSFSLSPGAILVLSSIYFFGGIKSLAAVALAVAAHEAGHAAAIYALGGKVKGLRFDSSGFCLCRAGTYSTAGEAAILLSGPLAGIALAYVCAVHGSARTDDLLLRTAGMSLALTVYNLLPALPLDGGMVLYCLLCRFASAEKAERILYFTSLASALSLAVLGLAVGSCELGLVLLISAAWLLIAQTGIVKSMSLL